MIFRLLLKSTKYLIPYVFVYLSINLSNASEVYNYYNFIQKRHIPEEIKALIPSNEFIVDFSVGHINNDQYWDVVLLTTSQEEYIQAKSQNRLPQHRILKLFLGDGNNWKLYKTYPYLFRNEAETALSSYYGFRSLVTDNLFYFSKVYKIYQTASGVTPTDATGGFNIIQSFKKYGYEYRFTWDTQLNNWIYEGAVVNSYRNEDKDSNDYYNLIDHTWELPPKNNQTITIDEFFIQHPQFPDTVNLNPEYYPKPKIIEEPYMEQKNNE